jgi:hypothetical protein
MSKSRMTEWLLSDVWVEEHCQDEYILVGCFSRLPSIPVRICGSRLGSEYTRKRLPSVSNTWSRRVCAACVTFAAIPRGSKMICILMKWWVSNHKLTMR